MSERARPQHVLITGASGLVGTELCAQLLAEGRRVTAFTRGEAGEREGVRWVQWQPRDRRGWRHVLDDVDAVVHLAGRPLLDGRWTDAHVRECEESRVLPTTELAHALLEAPPRPRTWISASAVGYYGMHRGDDVLDEREPAGDASDVLAALCTQWEAAAEPARAAGVRLVKARVGLVLARELGLLKKMLPPFRLGVGGPVGSGRQYMPWIHRHDAAAALRFALDCPELEGPMNLTAPDPVTMQQFAKALGQALGRPSALPVPAFVVRLALGRGADAALTGQRAVSSVLLAQGYSFRFPVLLPALQELLS